MASTKFALRRRVELRRCRADQELSQADIGINKGYIAGIGKGGNPDVMEGVTPGMVVGVNTEVIAGEKLIITAGAIDAHGEYPRVRFPRFS